MFNQQKKERKHVINYPLDETPMAASEDEVIKILINRLRAVEEDLAELKASMTAKESESTTTKRSLSRYYDQVEQLEIGGVLRIQTENARSLGNTLIARYKEHPVYSFRRIHIDEETMLIIRVENKDEE